MMTKALTGVALLLVAVASQGEEILTNDHVIRLVRAGLTMATIETKIYASQVSFDTGTDALIDLTKEGVPDQVVRAMIVRQSEMRRSVEAPAVRPAAVAQAPAIRRFDVAVHRTATARCNEGELTVSATGVKTSRCGALNFNLSWRNIQSVSYEFGTRGTVLFKTAGKTYRISTPLPVEAERIVEVIGDVRPSMPIRAAAN